MVCFPAFALKFKLFLKKVLDVRWGWATLSFFFLINFYWSRVDFKFHFKSEPK